MRATLRTFCPTEATQCWVMAPLPFFILAAYWGHSQLLTGKCQPKEQSTSQQGRCQRDQVSHTLAISAAEFNHIVGVEMMAASAATVGPFTGDLRGLNSTPPPSTRSLLPITLGRTCHRDLAFPFPGPNPSLSRYFPSRHLPDAV